jgi:uncharacterized protein (DUF305 family)
LQHIETYLKKLLFVIARCAKRAVAIQLDCFVVPPLITRTYMALLMVAPMTVTMLLLMGPMYKRRGLNIALLAASVAVFATSLALLRTQTPITDIQYMRAMIPHHSSAIMTSRHASLRDPETRQLASQIIASQEREIARMKRLIARLEAKQSP